MRQALTTMVLLLVIAGGCTGEYDFPDAVPMSGAHWVDPPLRGELESLNDVLVDRVVAEYPALHELACSDAEVARRDVALRQARGSLSFAVDRGVRAAAIAMDGHELEVVAAPQLTPPAVATSVTCMEPAPSAACVVSAAREAVAGWGIVRAAEHAGGRQAEMLRALSEQYRDAAKAVVEAGTLRDPHAAGLAATPFVDLNRAMQSALNKRAEGQVTCAGP